MNFTLNKQLYDINYLYIMEPVSNNVIENGIFYRLMYSNSHMTLNSLIFEIHLEDVNVTKMFNKYKITYTNKSDPPFRFIETVENEILQKFEMGKTPRRCIMDCVKNDNIKLYSEKELLPHYDSLTIYIKVSGFWLNESEYGLTYKFLH